MDALDRLGKHWRWWLLLVWLLTCALLILGLGLVSATTNISGAVIAPGAFVVDSSVKKIQHPTGGIVATLKVRNGDVVRAGDLLIRLDATMATASLSIVTKSLDEFAVRKARLESERDSLDHIELPAAIAARTEDADLRAAIVAERKMFETRRAARLGQKAQFRERATQLNEEIRGLDAQSRAKSREVALIERELEGVRDLFRKNLVSLARLTQLEREAVRIGGENGQLIASVARAKAKIAETELQIIQIDQDLGSEVAKELRDTQAKIAELLERRVAAEDQLKRIDIRAPVDGIVHQLAVHTVGGVIGQGETLMAIVPASDKLVIEVKVSPQDIDQVRIDLPTILRFTTLSQRTTPELNGKVTYVSADLVADPRTGSSHFVARISLADEEVTRLDSVKIVPGLPIEAYIQTEQRSILSYMAKPLSDQIERAFRER
jgi:HlyD family secretion protein